MFQYFLRLVFRTPHLDLRKLEDEQNSYGMNVQFLKARTWQKFGMRHGLTIFNYDALEADELWGVVWGRYTYLDHSLSLSAQILKVE